MGYSFQPVVYFGVRLRRGAEQLPKALRKCLLDHAEREDRCGVCGGRWCNGVYAAVFTDKRTGKRFTFRLIEWSSYDGDYADTAHGFGLILMLGKDPNPVPVDMKHLMARCTEAAPIVRKAFKEWGIRAKPSVLCAIERTP